MNKVLIYILAAMIIIPVFYWLYCIHWSVAVFIAGIAGVNIIKDE